MLLDVSHRTKLSYDAPIGESVIELRIGPPSNAHQSVRAFGLAVDPAAPLFEHLDWLGNRVHQFSILDSHQHIEILSHLAVDTHPVALDLAGAEDPLPLGPVELWLRDFLHFGGPVVEDPRLASMSERLGLGRAAHAANAVMRVMLGLRDALEYRKGVTTAQSTVADALSAGGGVCQDFAQVAIALLRRLGVPTRYVSGYLYRPELPDLETHAWCDAHVPSLGWVGFDPTHAQFVGERHIVLAVGRSFLDVPPNRGTFKGQAIESIAVSVKIGPLDTVPRALLAGTLNRLSPRRERDAPHANPAFCWAPAQQTPLHQLLPRQQQNQQQQVGAEDPPRTAQLEASPWAGSVSTECRRRGSCTG